MEGEDKRLEFLQDATLQLLKLKQDKWNQLIAREDNQTVISNLFEKPDSHTLVIYLNALNQLVASRGFPQNIENKGVYFIKRGKEVITKDNTKHVIVGDVSNAPVEAAIGVIEEIKSTRPAKMADLPLPLLGTVTQRRRSGPLTWRDPINPHETTGPVPGDQQRPRELLRSPADLLQTCYNSTGFEKEYIMSPKAVIFKKISRDKSVGVYIPKRDFVDHCDFVDPIDGVVLIDPTLLKGKKVYIMLTCTFKYGKEGDEVLGVAFRRDIFVSTRQVYPPLQDKDRSIHSKMQKKLLNKLGENAHPFFFEFPDNLPCSVAVQPGPLDEGKQCAVEFEVKAFSSERQDEIHKRSSARLAIRKIQYAPENKNVIPIADTTFEFVMSDKPLHMVVTLEKETYYHGEPINVTVDITNGTNRTLKGITVLVEQITNVVLYCNDKYVKPVAKEETEDTVPAGTNMKKVYTVLPLLAENKNRRGLALDGKLKHQDTNLASSSIVKDEVLKEVLGMLVSYRVVVRLIASAMIGSSEVSLEVPFRLMHPKPEPANESEADDMVIEEFKRVCLKGMSGMSIDDGDEEEGQGPGQEA